MQDAGAPQVRTLLLTDLVDSTHLVERLGDAAAAALFRAHDRLVLELQHTALEVRELLLDPARFSPAEDPAIGRGRQEEEKGWE